MKLFDVTAIMKRKPRARTRIVRKYYVLAESIEDAEATLKAHLDDLAEFGGDKFDDFDSIRVAPMQGRVATGFIGVTS